MLKRYFISNIVLMVLLNLLVKPFWIFAIDRKVQVVVGDEEYGLYGALLSLTIVFNILLDLGLTNFNNKSIAEDIERTRVYLPNMLVAKSLLGVLFMVVILVFAWLLNYNQHSLYLLSLIGLGQLLASWLLYLRSNISAHHDFKIDSLLSIADKLFMIVFCSILLFVPKYRSQFQIAWFIYAQLLSYGLSIVIAFSIVFFRYAGLKFTEVKWQLLKKLMRESLPFALLILLMGIYMRFDSVLLERLLPIDGKEQNGIYLKAFRLLDALNIFGVLFAGMLLPMFSRMLANRNNIAGLVQTTANILLPISFVIAANALFFHQEIMDLLYDHNTQQASSLYRFVMLSFPAFCILYIYSTLLTANGNLRLLIGVALVSCLLSISGNLIFIPLYKSVTVALVALIVHWVAAGCFIFFSIRYTVLRFQWEWVAQFVLFFSLFILLNYIFRFVGLTLLWSLILNILIFIPSVFILRLWRWHDLTKYFQEIVVKSKQ